MGNHKYVIVFCTNPKLLKKAFAGQSDLSLITTSNENAIALFSREAGFKLMITTDIKHDLVAALAAEVVIVGGLSPDKVNAIKAYYNPAPVRHVWK